jgi:hypothetical protein
VRTLKEEIRRSHRHALEMKAAYQSSAPELSLSGTGTDLDAAAAEGGVASAPGPSMCHMLIVEDDAFQAESISILCKQCGYRADVACNGTEVASTHARAQADGAIAAAHVEPFRTRGVTPLSRLSFLAYSQLGLPTCLLPLSPHLPRRWASSGRTRTSTWCCPTS